MNRFVRYILLRDGVWNEFLTLLDKSIKFVFHYRTVVGVTIFSQISVFSREDPPGEINFTEICENEGMKGESRGINFK